VLQSLLDRADGSVPLTILSSQYIKCQLQVKLNLRINKVIKRIMVYIYEVYLRNFYIRFDDGGVSSSSSSHLSWSNTLICILAILR
jgi:hypothetical protein